VCATAGTSFHSLYAPNHFHRTNVVATNQPAANATTAIPTKPNHHQAFGPSLLRVEQAHTGSLSPHALAGAGPARRATVPHCGVGEWNGTLTRRRFPTLSPSSAG
jgi:hypothetical protein